MDIFFVLFLGLLDFEIEDANEIKMAKFGGY